MEEILLDVKSNKPSRRVSGFVLSLVAIVPLVALTGYAYMLFTENSNLRKELQEKVIQLQNDNDNIVPVITNTPVVTKVPDDAQIAEDETLKSCTYEDMRAQVLLGEGYISRSTGNIVISEKCQYDVVAFLITKLNTTTQQVKKDNISMYTAADGLHMFGVDYFYNAYNVSTKQTEIRVSRYDFSKEKETIYFSFPTSWKLIPRFVGDSLNSDLDTLPGAMYDRVIYVSTTCSSYPGPSPEYNIKCVDDIDKAHPNVIGFYGVTREDTVEYINK